MAASKGSIGADEGVPSWARLSKAESRNLYKPEPAPSNKWEEDYLLTMYRKLNREQRERLYLTANSWALERIKARLQRDRQRKRHWPANVIPLRPHGKGARHG